MRLPFFRPRKAGVGPRLFRSRSGQPLAHDAMAADGFGAFTGRGGFYPIGLPLPYGPNFQGGGGAGTAVDANEGNAFTDIYLSQVQLEIIYRASWAARKLVDIPVDDMFVPGRTWIGDDPAAVDAMEEAEHGLDAHLAMRRAMKAARLYGSGLLLIMSSDASPETPLDPDEIAEGSISNLIVVDRWAASIHYWYLDPTLPNYGQPYLYLISPRITHGEVADFYIHHSRVLRFDGIRPPLSEGWNSWDRDWGASELTAAINHIGRDENMSVAIGHLMQEASVMMVKVQGFKQALQGRPDLDDPPLDVLAAGINGLKSVFRTGFIDREDDIERVGVAFSGVADILDRNAQRMAAIADIPMTRFFAQSPAGQNATGDSDWRNYAVRVGALQETLLTEPLRLLDRVLARNAGMADPPEFEWRPLQAMSPAEEAEVAKASVESVVAAVTAGIITEEEARERLATLPLFGELPPMTDSLLADLRRITEGPPPEEQPGGGNENGEGETGGEPPGG